MEKRFPGLKATSLLPDAPALVDMVPKRGLLEKGVLPAITQKDKSFVADTIIEYEARYGELGGVLLAEAAGGVKEPERLLDLYAKLRHALFRLSADYQEWSAKLKN